MQKVVPEYPKDLPPLPNLSKRITQYYPSAFHSDKGQPLSLGEAKSTPEEYQLSVRIWHACLEDGHIQTPYAHAREGPHVESSLTRRMRSIPGNSDWYLWITVAGLLQTTISQVLEDVFRFPPDPRVDFIQAIITFNDNIDPLPQLVLPLYERFFYYTRRFLRPLTERQAQLALTPRSWHYPLLLTLFYSEADVDMSVLKLSEEEAMEHVGAVNTEWVYIGEEYLTTKYTRKEIPEAGTYAAKLDALETWTDAEIKDVLECEPPSNTQGLYFTNRRRFIQAWFTLAHGASVLPPSGGCARIY